MKIGSFVWHSRRKDIKNAVVEEFYPPVKIVLRNNYFTCQPASSGGYLQVAKYGENITNMWNCIANTRAFNREIKNGDLMWVDGEEPDFSKDMLNTATARVVGVDIVNNTMLITLEKSQNSYED